jgi:hypothetical protein
MGGEEREDEREKEREEEGREKQTGRPQKIEEVRKRARRE